MDVLIYGCYCVLSPAFLNLISDGTYQHHFSISTKESFNNHHYQL